MLSLRVPHDYEWQLYMPNAELWHAIIDEFGFPEWLRVYDLSEPRNMMRVVTVKEEFIRETFGHQFFSVMVAQDSTKDPPRVYGYMPVDFERYDLLCPTLESAERDKVAAPLPGGWVKLTRPPRALLA